MRKKKNKQGRIATTIKINPEIWKQAKIRAVELDMTTSEFLETAIQKHLEATTQKTE
jgi:post-segregation antitoxin (ccd killing protein)